MQAGEITALVAASGAFGAALLKGWDLAVGRDGRAASTGKIKAETRATDIAAAQAEVTLLREIIGEVRDSEAKKAQRIDNLEHRMALLEDRERHMLTRAAVHEAWDQMAFALLAQVNPDHPPPPPLTNHDEWGGENG